MYITDQNINQWGDHMELNFEGLKMQKWNVQTDTVQTVDQKKRVICLAIMFTQEDFSVAFNLLPKLCQNLFCLFSNLYKEEPCFTF